MKARKATLSVLAGIALAAPLAVAASPATAAPEELAVLEMATTDAIAGSYIVYLKDNAEARSGMSIAEVTASAAADAVAMGVQLDAELPGIGGFIAKMTDAQVAELRKDSRVEAIAQDYEVSLPEVATKAADVEVQAVGSWGLDRINQKSLPLDNKFSSPGNQGRGVTAYVIDTGISAHGEYSGRLSSRGYDSIDNDNNAEDCQGHGSHVAGTVAGNSVGVAPRATLVGVRVLNCEGKGSASGVIKGIDWVTANAVKPAVANLSLGGPKSSVENRAIARLVNSGVTTAVAAGNEETDACKKSPASEPLALTVASSNKRDGMSWFSNYGSCVDIYAPGSDIRSVTHTGRGYKSNSGTSMASPHVAGVAAVILSNNSGWSPRQIENKIKSDAVRGKISKTLGSPNLLLQVGNTGGGGGGGGDNDDDNPVKPVQPGEYVNTERKTIRNYGSATTSLRSTTSGAKSLKLTIDVNHACANHLKIDLTTPDGVKNTVKRSSYASGRRCFSWNGEKSETYSMRSKSNGSWSLTVADDYSGASGTLNGWKIKLS